jgi:HEAT repeat protein
MQIQSIHRSYLPRSIEMLATLAFAAVLVFPPVAFSQAVNEKSEPALIKILAEGTDSGEKAMACKRLAVYGTVSCVPEVAKLLSDPQLASWARITLEAIPGAESNAALRDAAGKLEGLLLVGVINSLGVRRDAQAVELLTAKLKQGSADVASAAALALGHIGNEQSLAALRESLPTAAPNVQSAVAEGCIYAAEHQFKSGNTALATQVYDEIRNGKYPAQRVVEATRGAILVRGEEGVPLLIEQLRSPSRKQFAIALQTARELSSNQLGQALVAELSKASADRAPLIVEALAELKGKTDLAALQSLAETGSKEVKLAAIGALSRLGDVSCVDRLLKVARQSADLNTAVRAALVALPDPQVDSDILKRLPTAAEDQVILLEVVGLRQLEATDQLVKAIDSPDEKVRAAAIQSLGQTVPQAKLSTLIAQVVSPKRAADGEAAARALKNASIRMPDREACAATLSDAVKSASDTTKVTLLETIGAVGGTKALETVQSFAMGKGQLRDVSTRLLGEWMTPDAGAAIWEIYNKGPKDQYQERLIKGYIRIARQFNMPEEQRLDMCRKALSVAKLKEQKSLFDIVKKFPSAGMAQFAADAAKEPQLKEDALATLQAIKGKLANNAEALKVIEDAGVK